MLNQLNQLRISFSDNFQLIRWLVFVFIGGSINSVVYYFYRDIYYHLSIIYPIPVNPPPVTDLSAPQIQLLLNLILPTLIFFSLTLVISLFLTKIKDDRKLIPPFFLQGITFGLFMITFVNPQSFPSLFLEILMLGIYVYIAGRIQDKIMIMLLGYGDKMMINKKSFLANTSLEKAHEKFSNTQYLDNLNLYYKPKIIDGGFRYRNKPESPCIMIIDIKQVKTEDDIEFCSINIAVFKKGRYEINEDCSEYLNGQCDIISGFLNRGGIKVTNNTDLKDIEQLTNDISDKLQGISHQIEKVTSLGWVRVVAFIIILGSVGYLFYDKGSTEGVLGVLVMFLLYIVFETRGFRERPR